MNFLVEQKNNLHEVQTAQFNILQLKHPAVHIICELLSDTAWSWGSQVKDFSPIFQRTAPIANE